MKSLTLYLQAFLAFLAPQAVMFMERERFGVRSFQGPRSSRGIGIPIFSDTGYGLREQGLHPFGEVLGIPDPLLWHTLFTDFDVYLASDWVVTETQAGATQALTAGAGGLMLFTNSAADNDVVELQWAGGSGAVLPTFRFTAGKPLVFGARLQVSDAVQADVMCGLWIADTSPVASQPADGVWFYKADDAAAVAFEASKGSTKTSAAAIASMVSATMMTFEFAYDGGSRIYYGINGRTLGSIANTNMPDTADVALSVALQNGEAVAKTLTIDYLYAAQYRG